MESERSMSPRKFITKKELAFNPPVVLGGEPGEGAGALCGVLCGGAGVAGVRAGVAR